MPVNYSGCITRYMGREDETIKKKVGWACSERLLPLHSW